MTMRGQLTLRNYPPRSRRRSRHNEKERSVARYARNLRRASGVAKGRSTRLMLFGRRKPTPLPEAARMGFRSRLVLAKLGFDLRQRYDDLFGRELPDELGRLASQLNPSVVEVGNEPIRRGPPMAQIIGGGGETR